MEYEAPSSKEKYKKMYEINTAEEQENFSKQNSAAGLGIGKKIKNDNVHK